MRVFYEVQAGSEADRAALRARLPELDLLSEDAREAALVAWSTAILSSGHTDLDRLPFSAAAPDYSLLQHVQEVTHCGQMLGEYARERWDVDPDPEILLPVLLLHDVDKPLLYDTSDRSARLTSGPGAVPHGVLGAMLLNEVGFGGPVVEIVSTHAVYSPFHSDRVEGWILHYADLFAADHVMRSSGLRPFYQGHE